MKSTHFSFALNRPAIRILVGILTAGLIFFLMTSCEEQNFDDDPGDDDLSELPGEVQDLFEELSAEIETYEIDDVELATFFESDEGMFISIPGNCFVHLDGSAVTGKCDVELIEVLSVKDMILSNKPTMSNGKALISGGEFYLNVTQNGQQLKINDGKSIFYSVPIDDDYFRGFDDDMQLFVGDSLEDGSIDWQPVEDTQVAVDGGQGNERDSSFAYYFEWDEFGWTNVDKFADFDGLKSDIKVTVPQGFGPKNTAVFLVLKDELSVLAAYWSEEEMAFVLNDLPVGYEFIAAAVSEAEDKFYFDLEDFTMEENQVINLEPGEATTEEIEAALEQL